MQIILTENVPNLGSIGDLVKVKDGYARNYLLPRKLAIVATPKSVKQFEHQKRVVAARMEKLLTSAKGLKEKLEGLSLSISRQVGEEDKLFGSVTTKDIAEALEDKGFDVDRKKIVLDAPIKTQGVFQVPVKLHQDVFATLKVWVVPK
jgi:large subunit ribosomal protein L9